MARRICDSLEVVNPGGLVSSIPKEDFGKRNHSLNPLLFSLFIRMDMVERIGSGIKRVQDLMKEEKLPPPEFSLEGMFVATLKRHVQRRVIVDEGVNEGVIELLLLIKNNPGKRAPFFTEKLDVPTKTIERWLKNLRAENKIEFRGVPKTGGYWVLDS